MRSPAPHPLHRICDFKSLAAGEFADVCLYLGSYWPYNTNSYESRLVKAFKESLPAQDFAPALSVLCDFYASNIVEKLPSRKIDFVVRALSSRETSADKSRPQGLLVSKLCKISKACDVSEVFFRSQVRAPMRMVSSLSGSVALNTRIKYAAQDLFVKQTRLHGRVLVVDDIANTGATMALYAWALKNLLGASEVWCANLAITRYHGGKDGKGFLQLDTAELAKKQGFQPVYADTADTYHSSPDCLVAGGKTSTYPVYYAARKLRKCHACRF